MKTTINVTQEHIDNGKRVSCRRCPIALAMSEQMPNAFVDVHPNLCFISTESMILEVFLPSEASNFINRFDGARKVEPFSFELDIPDELLAEAKQ